MEMTGLLHTRHQRNITRLFTEHSAFVQEKRLIVSDSQCQANTNFASDVYLWNPVDQAGNVILFTNVTLTHFQKQVCFYTVLSLCQSPW